MNPLPRVLVDLLAPLGSPFTLLAALLALAPIRRRVRTPGKRSLAVAGVVVLVSLAYHLAALDADVARWLAALDTPMVAVFLVVVLPAIALRGTRAYRWFLVVPAATLLLAVVSVVQSYREIPESARGFYWILIRPSLLMGGIASLLVLLHPLLSPTWFRRSVRIACLLVLLYGGFALRTSYVDYTEMLSRRGDRTSARMVLDDTTPVLKSDTRLLYLPGAPCRFSSDGGYVQGCNLELFQRLLQIDFAKVASGDPPSLHALSLALAALFLFLAMLYVTGRLTCGWLCPLSTLGDLFSWIRAKLGLPYWKPSKGIKAAAIPTGLSLAGIALLMSRAYPSLDADGRFFGCKIPIYPFCKLCPAQQVCPVAAKGPEGYPPVPGVEWAWGFFTVGAFLLLALYLLPFMAARRLWCRMCPMGMVAGCFNRGSLTRLEKDSIRCNGCGTCAEVCPMDIDLVRKEMVRPDVSSYDCVLCLRCVEHCPRDGCLTFSIAGTKVAESKFR